MIEHFYELVGKRQKVENIRNLLKNYNDYLNEYIYNNKEYIEDYYFDDLEDEICKEIKDEFDDCDSFDDVLNYLYRIEKKSYSAKITGYQLIELNEVDSLVNVNEYLNEDIFNIIYNNIDLPYEKIFSLLPVEFPEELFRCVLIFVISYLFLMKIDNGESIIYIVEHEWNNVCNCGLKKGDVVYLNKNIDELYLINEINKGVVHLILINSTVSITENAINIIKYDAFKLNKIKFTRDNINKCKYNIINNIYNKALNYIYEKEEKIIKNKYDGNDLLIVESAYFFLSEITELNECLKNNNIEVKKYLNRKKFNFENQYELELVKYEKAFNTLLMAEWVNILFNEKFGVNKEIDGERDYTFVVAEYIKTVEILLIEKLYHSCFNRTLVYYKENNKSIVVGSKNWETKLTLGNIYHILLNYKDIIFKNISNSDYKKFCDSIDTWIRCTRNDHFHKDLIFSKTEADKIIDDTYNIISLICLLLK